MRPLDLSIILLAYNEADNLAGAVQKVLAYLDKLPGDHELIIVDDGSTDDTADIARSLAENRPNVRLLRHATNRGMGAGMRTGIMEARKPYFEAMAADGQVDPSETGKLLAKLLSNDFVISRYTARDDGASRTALSWGFRKAVKCFLGGCVPLEGLYIFPTAPAQSIIREGGARSDTFLFSFELLQKAVSRGMRYETVSIDCRPRTAGASKVANVRRIARIVRELWQTR